MESGSVPEIIIKLWICPRRKGNGPKKEHRREISLILLFSKDILPFGNKKCNGPRQTKIGGGNEWCRVRVRAAKAQPKDYTKSQSLLSDRENVCETVVIEIAILGQAGDKENKQSKNN